MNRKIGLNIEMNVNVNVNFQLKSINLDAATFIYKIITILFRCVDVAQFEFFYLTIFVEKNLLNG